VTDRLEVDPASLHIDAVEFAALANLGESIGRDLLGACQQYRGCGGTGEMGEKFNATYPAGERAALEYLVELATAFGGNGDRLAKAVRIFTEAESDSRGATRK
jgi:hypothetical protein